MFTHVFYNPAERHFVAFCDYIGYVAFDVFAVDEMRSAANAGVDADVRDAVTRKGFTLHPDYAREYVHSIPAQDVDAANAAVNAANM